MGSDTLLSCGENQYYTSINGELRVVKCRQSSESSSAISSSPISFTANSSVSSGNQSKENLSGYFSGLRDQRMNSNCEKDDQSTQSSCSFNKGVGGLSRSRTRHIFSSSEKFQSHPDLKDLYDKQIEREDACVDNQETGMSSTKYFGKDINKWTHSSPEEPMFDNDLRNFIDGHISKARKTREDKYQAILKKIGVDKQKYNTSAASNSFVPYPALRHERRFLYDVDCFPLHQHLADTLGVSDLSLIHQHPTQDKKILMKPLLDSKRRQKFHKCYDNFVTSFCIPLLHSHAIGEHLFNETQRNGRQNKISYRYQAFPCIRVNRPGEFSIGPHCDMSYGHSMGNINFHIPLTPTYGTNALYTESHPGREDWHPLKTKAIGLGYSFDGARCIHFTLENTTMHTRVSLDFRVAIHRETTIDLLPSSITPNNAMMMIEYSNRMKESFQEDEDDERYGVHGLLCSKKMLQDNYSIIPGYYDQAHVDLGMAVSYSYSSNVGPGPVVFKRNDSTLIQPDSRVGFPF